MAKRAKASEPSAADPEAEVAAVDEPVAELPPQVNPTPEPLPAPASPPPALPPGPPPVTATGPSFGGRLRRFFLFLLRLISLLILLSLLSLGLYLTLPWLYQRFIRPVEQNTAQVQKLQSRQEQTDQQIAALQATLDAMSAGQDDNVQSLTDLDQRLSDLEKDLSARSQSLAELEKMQEDLQTQNEAVSAELDRQIKLLKSMELLSRARLSMYQSNFGLAKGDVQIARDLLASIPPDADESLTDDLSAIIQRLDLTLSNLPDFPVAASDDLDIAWQILLAGLPQVQIELSPTPTAIATFTPSGVLDVTPNGPGGTPTPTLVATLTLQSTPTSVP